MSPPVPSSRLAMVGLTSFVGIALLHLVLLAFGLGDPITRVTQGLLMPTLAVWAFAPLIDGSRLPRRVAVPLGLALTFSFVGDLAPGFLQGDAGFLGMVAAFFVAQIAWVVALWPWRARSVLRTAWPMTLAYAGVAIAVLVLTVPGAGWLSIAIVPYAALLASMGVLATGLGVRGTVGGLLFMLSDAMIAIFTFAPVLNPGQPTRALAIMSTYCAAQAMLVWAVRDVLVSHRAIADARPAGEPVRR